MEEFAAIFDSTVRATVPAALTQVVLLNPLTHTSIELPPLTPFPPPPPSDRLSAAQPRTPARPRRSACQARWRSNRGRPTPELRRRRAVGDWRPALRSSHLT